MDNIPFSGYRRVKREPVIDFYLVVIRDFEAPKELPPMYYVITERTFSEAESSEDKDEFLFNSLQYTCPLFKESYNAKFEDYMCSLGFSTHGPLVPCRFVNEE